jgi:hypothetical protein
MTDADFLWKLITVGLVLANFAGTIVGIVVAFKRSPAFPEEAYQKFVTREQCVLTHEKADKALEEHRLHTAKIDGEQFEQIRQNRAASESDFKTLERAIGRLEGAPPIGRIKG